MNKKIIIIVFSIIVIAMIGVILLGSSKDDASPQTNELLTTIDNQDVLDVVRNQADGLVYVGRPTCSECVAFLPVLKQALENRDQQALYFNTDDNSGDEESFNKAISIMEIEVVPTVVAFKNGSVYGKLQGNVDYETVLSWLERLEE